MSRVVDRFLFYGILIGLIGAVLTFIGWLTIDVPIPNTNLFFVGLLLIFVAIVLTMTGIAVFVGEWVRRRRSRP